MHIKRFDAGYYERPTENKNSRKSDKRTIKNGCIITQTATATKQSSKKGWVRMMLNA